MQCEFILLTFWEAKCLQGPGRKNLPSNSPKELICYTLFLEISILTLVSGGIGSIYSCLTVHIRN